MYSPAKEEFLSYSSDGNFNLIAVSTELLADTETPLSAYRKIAYNASGEPYAHSFLLESVEGGENIARFSMLGVDPLLIYTHKDGKGKLFRNGKFLRALSGRDVFEEIGNLLNAYSYMHPENAPPFTGGAVGYASYDVISEFEDTVPRPEKDELALPEAFFMITDTLLVFDRVKHTIKIIAHAHLEDGISPEDAYAAAVKKIESLRKRLESPTAIPPLSLDLPETEPDFISNKSPEEFRAMVEKTRNYIRNGDIIQAVISQRFEVNADISPLSLYRSLRMLNPSPYMFLLKCGDFSIVGASPEVHAKCTEGEITVRPIAGTRKRSTNRRRDIELEEELLADPKERAEHIMLVDLARNDVGRVAVEGSVNVDELMTIERYSHVMHIVSNVTGRLKQSLGPDSAMRSTFPAGTLSGAPKVRAMQIISELEQERRGPYGGVVAYYSFDGNVDSCITIRTAVMKDKRIFVQAGAGIVADSDPELEFQETLNKARALMQAIKMAESIA